MSKSTGRRAKKPAVAAPRRRGASSAQNPKEAVSAPQRASVPELEARVRELENQLSDMHQELERSERRVEAMKQIGRVLGSNLQLDPLLAEIVSRTTDLLEADRSTLFLVDSGTGELWSKVLEGTEHREIRLPIGEGIAGWVAQTGRSLTIADAYQDERFNREFDKLSGYKTRGMLVWPIRRPQSPEVLGVIQVLNKRVGTFARSDERLLEAIASEIGVALEVAALYREAVDRSEALERARKELVLLFETERAISQSQNLREMLETILDTALHTMNAKSGVVHVLDDREIKLEVLAARGTYALSLQKNSFQVGESIVGSVVKTKEPVCLNDLEGHKRGRVKARSVVAVPIRTRYAGTIGVLELLNTKQKNGKFTPSDVKTLSVVADQAGRAIVAERRRREREQSERLTTIGRMLSGIIHDLKTPMTLISGYTQVMALAESVEDRSQYAHLVHRQIDLLASMTKDLLSFAKGESSLLIRKVYIKRFMAEMQEYLEKEFEGSGVDFSLETKYRGAARFDETKLRRVFHNVARNAREAMPGGGFFNILVESEEGRLSIAFEDNGPGIPPELRDSLFEPFATARKVGGTGLGLAMVKQIATEHHGTVVCEPRKGGGTRFLFDIPLEN